LVHYEEYFHNSLFRKYFLTLADSHSKVQCNFVYPATDKLIAKYSKQNMYNVVETPKVYESVTSKYIDNLDVTHNDWIINVLENRKEMELCVFENEHFKLQKDYKFNDGDISTLYVLAHPMDRTLKSIRDLTGDHLPLLNNIREESYQAIQ